VSIGLIGLLDDIAALAKVAAASLDDVAGQAAKAGTKAAGVVIDDAAVTPRYVVGFAAARELPIVGRIAAGSLRNKLLILLPAALALNAVLPAAITPLLMLGGLYLCYEGAEKIYEAIVPHQAHAHETTLGSVALDPQSVEDQRIASAIKTDFILSAEIMAITLASLPAGSFWMQATVLALVGIGITIAVYGVVALIVKADDAGVALAGHTGRSIVAGALRTSGRALVIGVPYFLTALSLIGTAAMVWVGGGIFIHGLETYGLHQPAQLLHAAAEAVAAAMPAGGAAVGWIVTAAGSGLIGLLLGALLIPVVGHIFAPAWRILKQALPKRTAAAGN
jgi:predicted DNA repair protein MutK